MGRAGAGAMAQETETERAAKRELRGLKILLNMRELDSHQLIGMMGAGVTPDESIFLPRPIEKCAYWNSFQRS